MTRSGIFSGIVAPFVSWGLSAVVILGWPGYDPVTQSISLLANGPLGWLQTFAFAASGLLGVAWALGLPVVLGATERDRRLVRSFLLLQAAITLAFAIFPTDPGARAVTMIGKIHLANFYLYAITMPLTLAMLGLVMRRDPRWSRLARPTLIAAGLVIAAGALVPLTVDGPLTPWLGLLERLYVAIPSVWQVAAGLTALALLRPSRATGDV